jgi:ABC-2 type transport system permease protein
VIGVWRWELIKIGSLVRSRLALGLVVVVPFLLALGLQAQSASPSDTLFGRFVHESGFALPLVVLGFSSQWVLPLLVAVVAGDVLTGEDHLGTWPLLTTRATSRRTLLAGKVLAALTWTVLVVALLAASSLLAGLVVVGDQPVVGLSGALLGSGQALRVVVLAWLLALIPATGFAALAIAASAAARQSAVGIGAPAVLGLLMQLVQFLPGVDPFRHILLTTPFDAWHGIARTDPYYGPLWQGALVAAAWTVVALAVAAYLLARREFGRA